MRMIIMCIDAGISECLVSRMYAGPGGIGKAEMREDKGGARKARSEVGRQRGRAVWERKWRKNRESDVCSHR